MKNKLLNNVKKFSNIKYQEKSLLLKKYHMLYSTDYPIGIPKYLTCAGTVYFILNNISLINENYHLKNSR